MATGRTQRQAAKRRYEESPGMTVRVIAGFAGVTDVTVYRWAREGRWRRRIGAPRLRARDAAREAWVLDQRAKGETLEAIGRAMTPPLTRQRVGQLLKRLHAERPA